MDFSINSADELKIIAVQANFLSRVTRACPKSQTMFSFSIFQ